MHLSQIYYLYTEIFFQIKTNSLGVLPTV